MAKKELITFVSDLSGKEITDNDQPTVLFSLDGTDYAIDLLDSEQEKLRKILAPYIEVASKPKKERAAKKPVERDNIAADARKWAKEQGMDVPARGKLPNEVREAYLQATKA